MNYDRMNNKEYSELFNKDYNSLFKSLKKDVSKAGLNEKIPIRGSLEIGIVFSLFLFSIYSIFHWNYILTTSLFLLTFIRSTYLAHDLVHNQYFKNKKINQFFSYIFTNIILGYNVDWWIRDHNTEHHTWTNVAKKDVDIQIAGGIFIKNKTGLKFFHKHKKILYWFLLPFMWASFHYQSVKYLFTGDGNRTQFKNRRPFINGITLLIHYALLAGLSIYALPAGEATTIILSVYLIYGAISALVFIPNHVGMEVIEGDRYIGMNWMELQTRTSRNIKGGMFTHWLYGGLNTQIEHHLFPKMPRLNLLKASKITEEFCKQNNLFYYSVSAIKSYKEIHRELKNEKLPFLRVT